MMVGVTNQDYGDDPHSHEIGLWLLAEVIDYLNHFNEIDCFWESPYAQFIGSRPPKLQDILLQKRLSREFPLGGKSDSRIFRPLFPRACGLIRIREKIESSCRKGHF
jgi:hypothetical protein